MSAPPIQRLIQMTSKRHVSVGTRFRSIKHGVRSAGKWELDCNIAKTTLLFQTDESRGARPKNTFWGLVCDCNFDVYSMYDPRKSTK